MQKSRTVVLFINNIINWILYTSLFAAACAVGLCMSTERLVTGTIPSIGNPLHILVAGSTLMVYNIHYLIKRSKENISDRFSWSQRNRSWHLLFFVLGTVSCCYSVFVLPLQILAACVVLGVLSFAYSLPLLPIAGKKRLRDFGWIKILVLTGVWTIVTTILPILYHNKAITDFPVEIALRFVFMLVLCVAFDLRDMQTDLENKIYTLPNLIGVGNSYRLINYSLLLFLALSCIQYTRYPSFIRISGEWLTAIVTFLAVRYTKKHPSDRAYLALIDGMMLVYALLLLWH